MGKPQNAQQTSSAQLLFGPQASLLATVRKRGKKKGTHAPLAAFHAMHTINVQEKDRSPFSFCFFLSFSGYSHNLT
jgi:hypothetical protein